MDGMLHANMQRYLDVSLQPLIGREALWDTMCDLIIDAISALIVSLLGFIQLTLRRRRLGQNPGPPITKSPLMADSPIKLWFGHWRKVAKKK